MDNLEGLAGEIVEEFEATPGAQEFERTLQHGDGTTTTYRVDFTEIDPTGYTVRGVRHREGEHRELQPRRLARADQRGLADWLAQA